MYIQQFPVMSSDFDTSTRIVNTAQSGKQTHEDQSTVQSLMLKFATYLKVSHLVTILLHFD